MILTNENLFLVVLAFVWIIGAILQDLRRREVDNVWNFSLIGFALAYRFGVSVFMGDYWFFINGLIGFSVFLFLGNLFYYSRMFAGGDAKLLIALGTILPFSFDWMINLKIFGSFIFLFLLGGSIYVFTWSLFLVAIHWNKFKKEFVRQTKIYKHTFLISFVFVFLWLIGSFFIGIEFISIGVIFLLFPILLVFSKAVEEVCMVKEIYAKDLTEGDWLYEDLYVNGKKIKKSWEGVTKKELFLIRQKYSRKLLVKYGVPFTPSFLIGMLGLLYLSRLGWF